MAERTLRVRQVRSAARKAPDQRATLRGLGLTRIGRERTLTDSEAVRGMVRKVAHLVEIVEN